MRKRERSDWEDIDVYVYLFCHVLFFLCICLSLCFVLLLFIRDPCNRVAVPSMRSMRRCASDVPVLRIHARTGADQP